MCETAEKQPWFFALCPGERFHNGITNYSKCILIDLAGVLGI